MAGRVPDVSRRRREGAEAGARLRDRGRRRAGGARARREGARGAEGRARDAAHQPPARLPDLRPVRRVRAAGLHVPGRARRLAAIASRSASIRSRISAATCMYVPNRCILCTRCVRFMDDVAQDAVLNVSERGDRAYIGKFEGKDLTHPWAGNVVDLCPVGALLSKDFLNKARAWELDRTASVCTGCSQGCNIIVETRDNVVVRLRPRPNEDVNAVLHVRPRPLELPLDESRRPARGRRRCLARAGMRRSTGTLHWRAAARRAQGEARLRAGVTESFQRSAVSPVADRRRTSGAARSACEQGRGSAACRRGGSRAPRRSRGQRPRRGVGRVHADRTRRSQGLAAGDALIVADHDLTADDLRAGRAHRPSSWCRRSCRRGWPRPTSCSRSPTIARKRARSPTCADASSGSCRPRPRRRGPTELVRARRPPGRNR